MGVNTSQSAPSQTEVAQKQPLSAMRLLLLPTVAVIVIIADQLTKAWVIASLGNGRVVDVLGGNAQLDFTQNTGAAFGMFRQESIVFAVIAVVVAASIVINYRRACRSPWPIRLALGLVLGGAVGNLIDRVRLGYVVDFIDLRWWPVFNLADSAIVIGVMALVLWAFLAPQRSEP